MDGPSPGDKHFITDGEGAAIAIVMAATGEKSDEAVTMFVVATDTPGWTVAGHYDTLDVTMVGGHCSIAPPDCVVPDGAVLGEV